MNFKLINSILVLALLMVSCNEAPKPKQERFVSKKELLEHNRKSVRMESDQIDKYVSRRNWEMTSTGSGLRYMIYEEGLAEARYPKEYDTAVVTYQVSLINGKVIYESDSEKPATFVVGHDDVESGLQEGIRFMKIGDKAKLIVPAHLAHGYTGDFNKIPRSSTVIFDISLHELR